VTLSKNLTLQYSNAIYRIRSGRPSYGLRHAKDEVRERWDHTLTIFYKGKPLAHSVYRKPPRQAELFSSKELNPELDARLAAKRKRKAYVPPPDHPWRRFQITHKPSPP
jgi:hypothetical protein